MSRLASFYGALKFNQGLRYAATTASKTFGTTHLVYPYKSSVFRGLIKDSQKVGKVSMLGSLVLAEGQALWTPAESRLLSQPAGAGSRHSRSAFRQRRISASSFGGRVQTTFEVEGWPMRSSEYPVTTLHIVDRDYFRTLGIPLLSGRPFNLQDEAAGATPVVIISQKLAKQIFPGGDLIGRRIRTNISSGPGDAPMRLIVGVVGDGS